jgi:hypothetical protein
MGMKNITLSMPDEMIEMGRERAKLKGTTLNQMMRDLLQAELDEVYQDRLRSIWDEIDRMNLKSSGPYLSREEANTRG